MVIRHVYVYYEKFSAANPDDELLEVVLSSNGRANRIDFTNQQEKAMQVLVSNVFKTVPFDKRDYDGAGPNNPNPTHIWTFMDFWGNRIITVLNTGITQGVFPNLQIKEIKNLQEKCKRGRLDAPDVVIKTGPEEILFKEEEFFYSPAPSSTISGEELYKKLSSMLMITPEQLKSVAELELKKYYRKAAILYHPDRNQGDGSKMSELNMLWGIYKGN